jgi:hypothetical protein
MEHSRVFCGNAPVRGTFILRDAIRKFSALLSPGLDRVLVDGVPVFLEGKMTGRTPVTSFAYQDS